MSRRSPLLNGKGSSPKHRPERLGPFSVRADLGASRFGPVYLGRDPSTKTRVVIRTFELSREWREFGELSDLLESFRNLCEKTLDHPSLARPLAFGAERDIPFLVYSDLAGTAMDAVMRQDGPRPVTEVLQRTTQLAEAIDCAADAGVYHGLLAPCDVILDGERTGVTGFGLAQALIKVGMPADAASPYGSPQRLAGAPPTRADDIYSLAAITLELLIGTPADPDQDKVHSVAERRRIPRPAPHETRVFTTIPGVDAGKLRASFATAFSEEPSARPSTAAEFVASFQDALSSRHTTEEPAASGVAAPVVSDDASAPPLETKDVEEGPTLASPSHQEPIVTEKPTTMAVSQSLDRQSHEDELQERKPESSAVRSDPIVDVALSADIPLPAASAIAETPYGIPVQPASRAFLVAAAVAVSFGAGFGGGFVVGHFSRPSMEPIHVSDTASVAEPRPARASVDDPQPIASSAQAVASIPAHTVPSSAPTDAVVAPQRSVPGVESGRLLVRSRPAGASVVVDGRPRGVTPLTVRELALGAHTIDVSHPDHETRRQRVTLSERRPERSFAFVLRPTAPAPAAAPTSSTGSLHVASSPSGAQVFLDDNLIGTTPFLVSNIAAGSRRLRIELAGYQLWTTSIRIEPSGRARVSARLEQ